MKTYIKKKRDCLLFLCQFGFISLRFSIFFTICFLAFSCYFIVFSFSSRSPFSLSLTFTFYSLFVALVLWDSLSFFPISPLLCYIFLSLNIAYSYSLPLPLCNICTHLFCLRNMHFTRKRAATTGTRKSNLFYKLRIVIDIAIRRGGGGAGEGGDRAQCSVHCFTSFPAVLIKHAMCWRELSYLPDLLCRTVLGCVHMLLSLHL